MARNESSNSSKKIAVVTGANKGIGYAIVKGLCEKFDGLVYLTARDVGRGEAAVRRLRDLGLNPLFHQLDITDKTSIETLKDNIVNKHGGIDLLINNAGIAYSRDATFQEQAETIIKVNYFGTLQICEILFPILRQNARVVHLSSSLGLLSRIPSAQLRASFRNSNLTVTALSDLMRQFIESIKKGTNAVEGWGNSAYDVSKVGVSALTVVQQREFNRERPFRNISVNCCHPGYVATDMTRQMGHLSIERGARSALFLALEDHNLKGKFVWQDTRVVDWTGSSAV